MYPNLRLLVFLIERRTNYFQHLQIEADCDPGSVRYHIKGPWPISSDISMKSIK
ncbi:9089_t:CDS:2 [Entrophospora sp. SA101]|nr:9089_t:CDS:2 [Entrophospora sp. SA101]